MFCYCFNVNGILVRNDYKYFIFYVRYLYMKGLTEESHNLNDKSLKLNISNPYASATHGLSLSVFKYMNIKFKREYKEISSTLYYTLNPTIHRLYTNVLQAREIWWHILLSILETYTFYQNLYTKQIFNCLMVVKRRKRWEDTWGGRDENICCIEKEYLYRWKLDEKTHRSIYQK